MAVAERLHFTHVATALYITQPAVSAAIQALERSYGIQLFHRRVELTEAGRWLKNRHKRSSSKWSKQNKVYKR
ncbi:MAG: LysR family transcriptional regulator [Cyanobacteriota bacterium]